MPGSISAFAPTLLRASLPGTRLGPAPWEQPPDRADVVIVGAGIAGLVAAYELRKRGIDTHLLEAQPMSGGRVATADYGHGLTAESGLQEIWANNPLRDIAAELGIELAMRDHSRAHSTFMYGGRIFPDVSDGTMRAHWDSFLNPSDRQALQEWFAEAKALHHRAMTRGLADRAVRALQDMSYRQWVTACGLSELAQAWLRLHLEVEVGSDWSRFSALFALLEMEIFFDGGASCYVVPGGNSRLIDALERASGPLTLGAQVTGVRRTRGHGRLPNLEVRYLQDRRAGVIEAGRVVLAIPFHRVRQLDIEPSLSAAHWHALDSLEAGHYAPVHLLMDRERTAMTTRNGMPDALLTNGPIGYVYGVVASSDTRAVFSLLVHGERVRALQGYPLSASLRTLYAELDRLQPGFSDHVRDAHVYTYDPAAIPVWGPGRSPLDCYAKLLREPVDGLHFAGDYIHGAHSDSAALSGIHTALRIASELEGGLMKDTTRASCS